MGETDEPSAEPEPDDEQSGDGTDEVVIEQEPGAIQRLGRFVGAHRLYYSGVGLAMLAAGFLGYGMAQRWGAQQWGSFADWIVGGLTLAAVAVALWQASRGDHARLVDHEMTRRRENAQAVSDVWAGIAIMSLDFKSLILYLENLPVVFDGAWPRTDQAPDKPGNPIAFDIQERLERFQTKWAATVEPPVFNALTVLYKSDMYEPMRELVGKYRALIGGDDLLSTFHEAVSGFRPDVSAIDDEWTQVMGLRQKHLDLAQDHFSLDLDKVEAAIRERRHQPKRPPAGS